MASLHPILVPTKVLKDGRHKIRIAVSHNGKTRYLVTDIILDSTKEFRNGTIVRRPDAAFLNTKLRKVLLKYQEALDEIPYVNGLNCAEVVFLLKNDGCKKHRTLDSILEEYLENANLKESTATNYRYNWNVISLFLSKNMLAEHLTYATILGLDKFLRKRGMATSTVANYMALLATIVNYAKRCGYARYQIDPFAGYKRPEREIREVWLSQDEIKAIRDIKIEKPNVKIAQDIFMLSYYLGGINLVDILKINFKECSTTLRYIRTKTETRISKNKYVEFKIPEEAKEIIKRYMDVNGKLCFRKNCTKNAIQISLKYSLSTLAKAVGIKRLILYSARKSFSQHAFNMGINTSVIDYILGHSIKKEGSSLYFYIHVTPTMATEAVRKVLDALK